MIKNKEILLCFGTRPEWLKIKPLLQFSNLQSIKFSTLFTGQHKDLLNEISVDYRISINTPKENRLDQVIADCMLQFPNIDFEAVLIQGDTASAFGCALAAFNRRIKVIYLESGLRSYDLDHPYPEEAYRQMISRISNLNLCPTELSKQNLIQERVNGTIHVVGNTVLDNLVSLKDKCSYENIILITLHRRENIEIMDKWFIAIEDLAKQNPDIKFLLPIHPNPGVQVHKHLLNKVEVCKPMSHEDLLSVLSKSKLVITDSGGLQEEGSFLNKKVIVCRKKTERPEAISTGHLHICENPSYLKDIFDLLNKNYYINVKCPYGDGYSSKNVINAILNERF